jgi:hypothetical protein
VSATTVRFRLTRFANPAASSGFTEPLAYQRIQVAPEVPLLKNLQREHGHLKLVIIALHYRDLVLVPGPGLEQNGPRASQPWFSRCCSRKQSLDDCESGLHRHALRRIRSLGGLVGARLKARHGS